MTNINDIAETITIHSTARWLFSQLGQLVIAVGLISLVFNYAYRYMFDWTISSPLFYAATLVLALIVFVAVRRDYIFVKAYKFGLTEFSIHTLFGAKKVYPTSEFEWVPALHKTVNFPEIKAALSFYVRRLRDGKDIRNYSWDGFSRNDFVKISAKYGYRSQSDFKQNDFGKN